MDKDQKEVMREALGQLGDCLGRIGKMIDDHNGTAEHDVLLMREIHSTIAFAQAIEQAFDLHVGAKELVANIDRARLGLPRPKLLSESRKR